MARDPDFAPAWTTLAGIYSVFEYYQPSEARSDYPLWRSAGTAAARRAITLDPESAAAFAYLGQLQAYGGAWVEAFTSLDRAVELAPNDPAVLDAVAQIYNEAGYLIEGERLARRAVSLEPRVAVYRNTLGWAQLDSPAGVLDEALASLQSSLDLDPTLRGPYLQSLRGLVGVGRIAEARLLLERAIEHQAFDAPTAANYQRLFAAWASGEAQLRQEAPGLLGRVEGLAGIILGDPDIFFTGMRQQWDIQPRSNVLLYWPFPGNYRNDPRWRAYVRELGLLPLWQVRGFPAGCRALESDDFECTGVDDE